MALEVINWAILSFIVREAVRVVALHCPILLCYELNLNSSIETKGENYPEINKYLKNMYNV